MIAFLGKRHRNCLRRRLLWIGTGCLGWCRCLWRSISSSPALSNRIECGRVSCTTPSEIVGQLLAFSMLPRVACLRQPISYLCLNPLRRACFGRPSMRLGILCFCLFRRKARNPLMVGPHFCYVRWFARRSMGLFEKNHWRPAFSPLPVAWPTWISLRVFSATRAIPS